MKACKAIRRLLLIFACLAASFAAHAAPFATIAYSPTSTAAGSTTALLVAISDDAFGAFTGGSLLLVYDPSITNNGTIFVDNCGGITNATPGLNQLTVTNISVPASPGFQCQIYIEVVASAGGTFTTILNPGDFTAASPLSSNSNTSSATLTVVAPAMVTNTSDSGVGSLRDAINTVNGACFNGSAINFNIAGPGPHVITPITALPAVACANLPIDAYTQPGSAANSSPVGSGNNATIQVVLDGSACAGCNGLSLVADGIAVKGFAIHSFPGAGIVSTIGTSNSSNIYGNYIGTDAGGMNALGNGGWGVEIDSGYAVVGSGSFTDNNVISNNALGGILVLGATSAASINGNQVGGGRDGSFINGNGGRGIYFSDANYSSNSVSTNRVRNNGGAGIAVSPGTFTKVVVQDNESSGNLGLGIDFRDDGPTLNDEASVPYDTDGIQNYPVITSVAQVGGNTIVSGYLKSVPNRTANAILYANSSASPITEGERGIGNVDITTDGSGLGTFSVTTAGTSNNVSAQITVDTCGDGCVRSSEYSPKVAATNPLVVTSNNDSGPGSLRAVIDFANANCTGSDVITFNVPLGTANISVNTPLSTITCNNLVIDAFTQPGSSPNTLANGDNAVRGVTLNGFFTSFGNGFTISASNVMIRGFEIQLFRFGAGIYAFTIPGLPVSQIMGNMIGIDDFNGLESNQIGIQVPPGAAGIIVGTLGNGDRNIISGNRAEGILLQSGDLSQIVNNYIGQTRQGNGITPVPNAGGVSIAGATNTQIIGNLISGNTNEGILIGDSTGTVIRGNRLGLNNAGTNFANGTDAISFSTAGAFGSVGGTNAVSDGNTICSQHYGVHVASDGVSILGNSIVSCGGVQGIDLSNGGVVAANDSCDADGGANGWQNYPVITSAAVNGSTTTITGTFDSTGGRTFRLEFFRNFAGTPSNGSARDFMGTVDVATTLTPSCATPFSVTLPFAASSLDLITATATDLTSGSTSWMAPQVATSVAAPAVSLSVSTLDFGALLVNTVSAPLTIGLTNTGNATLNISSITASIPFSIASQTCGATLAATASCTYDITFGPTAPGTYTGLFTLTSDAPATPTATVNLVGVGMSPPSFALVTPTALTPGQTVPIAIQITNPTGNPASYGNFTMATLTYPVGYTNAAPGGGLPAGGCGDPSFTGGVGGGTTIGFGPGAGSVAPGTTCSIVAAQLVGPATISSYTFTIPPGGITVSSPFVYSNPTAIIVTTNVSATPVPGITISPSSLPFPSTVVGTSSTPVSLSINNSGNAPLNISLVTATGDFTSVNGCVGPIAPTASCSITVTFTPTAAGPRSGTLTITSDAPGSPHTVPLSGTGVVLTPGVAINPPSIVFPSQTVGTPSAAQTVSITNTGTGPLHISSVTTSGDFTNNAACPPTINPGPTNACVFTVTFTPTIAGPRTGTLTVTSDASGSPHSVALSGTGIALAPAVSLTPLSLTFASRTVGTTSTLQVITMANTGNAPLTITSITGSGDYAFASSCGSALAALASCTINVTFTPLAAGPRPGSLVIVDNAPGSPRTVPFSGTGTAGVTAVPMVSPGSLDFEAQAVGSSSAVQLVVVSNAGTGPLAVSSFSVTGEFAIAPPPGATPVPCPATVAPGSACSIGVVFRPAGTNLRQGVLTIGTDAGTLSVNVSGIGMVAEPPQLTMPLALDFGSRTIGIAGDGLALPMHNTSPYIAAIHELTATGDFDVSDTCATILAGDSCSLLVTFLPTQVGARTGTLTVRTMRDANPYVVSLTGVGIENVLPSIQASPIRVGFGNVFVGGNSSLTVTLRNAGRGPLHVSGILFTGDYSAGPSCVGTIQPGGSCAVNVTFSPMIPGGRQGAMRILSDDPNGELDVSLSGAGCYLPTPSHARAGLPLCGS